MTVSKVGRQIDYLAASGLYGKQNRHMKKTPIY
jgi:hypothetical protein